MGKRRGASPEGLRFILSSKNRPGIYSVVLFVFVFVVKFHQLFSQIVVANLQMPREPSPVREHSYNHLQTFFNKLASGGVGDRGLFQERGQRQTDI